MLEPDIEQPFIQVAYEGFVVRIRHYEVKWVSELLRGNRAHGSAVHTARHNQPCRSADNH
jgi:hypothetical protein